MIYLDNAATTKPSSEVLECYLDISRNYFANPASLHNYGQQAQKIITEARKSLAELLVCTPASLIFTSGGTESNNLAIVGSLLAKKNSRKILVSAIEHPSVLELKKLIEDLGHSFETVKVNQSGVVDLDDLNSKLDKSVELVSVMGVNNETGVIQPMEKIVQVVKEFNQDILIHSDMVQALGKIPLNLQRLNLDLASFSAHKLHGVKGSGLLYVKNCSRLKPFLQGGGQQQGLRSGTENCALSAAFLKSCELAKKALENNHPCFKQIFFDYLNSSEIKYRLNSPESSSPYILSLSFYKFKAEVLVHALEEEGVVVSTVSACSSKKSNHSHVLSAMGVEDEWNRGTIRISFNYYSTESECREAAEKLCSAVKRLAPFMK